MTEISSTGHAFTSATGQVIFTEADVAGLHADDRSAAIALIGLMVSIFAIGLVGYLCVAAWCSMW